MRESVCHRKILQRLVDDVRISYFHRQVYIAAVVVPRYGRWENNPRYVLGLVDGYVNDCIWV
jgi:hypothetical protein